MLTDIEIRQLRALHAVATEGTFARAAARLGFTQSAVSQQIAGLERAVGEKVLDRPGGPRPAVLTPIGELLLAHATDLIARQDELERALRELRAGETGRISIGTFQSTSVRILPQVLGQLRMERPRLEIVCGEVDAPSDTLAGIRNGTFDVSFVVGDVPDEFVVTPLLVDPFVLLAPQRDQRTSATVHDLAELPMIGQNGGCCQAGFEATVEREGVDLRYVFRSNDNAAVQAMVRADMGYAVMPLLAVDADDPTVNIVRFGDSVPPRVISLVRPRDRAVNAAVDRFVELALEAVDRIVPVAV